MTQEQQNFIERVGKSAAADMIKSRVLASVTIAQAILESSWGKSGLTVKANALFGIKATSKWKGKAYNIKTKECYDGATFTTIDACFRAYDSWEESITDHSALFTGASRYAAVIGETDYKRACNEVKAAGYATDPDYPAKLIKLIEQYELMKYDIAQAGKPATAVQSETPYTVKVTANTLNIRKGAGTNYAVNGAIKDKGIYTIVEEADGEGAKKWGKLKSVAGWISLDYTQKQ